MAEKEPPIPIPESKPALSEAVHAAAHQALAELRASIPTPAHKPEALIAEATARQKWESLKRAVTASRTTDIQQGIAALPSMPREDLADFLISLSGTEVYQLRRTLGAPRLKKLLTEKGLTDITVDIPALIASSPRLQTLTAQLPPYMLIAIAGAESNGSSSKQFDVSTTGSLGCMQQTKYVYLDMPPPINPFHPLAAMERAAEHLLDIYLHGKDTTTLDPALRERIAARHAKKSETVREKEAVEEYNGGPLGMRAPGADPRYYAKYLREQQRQKASATADSPQRFVSSTMG